MASRRLASVAALLLLSASANAQDGRTTSTPLKIAVWRLQEQAAPSASDGQRRYKFRHSFGSQRKPAPEKPAGDPVLLGADVYLLHGIGSLALVRALFPARDYQVILSKQLLRDSGGLEPPLTTGVAISRTAGLRVSGQDHVLPPRTAEPDMPAATAVRITRGSSQVWLVAADLRSQNVARLRDWLAARASSSTTIVVAGPGMATASSALGVAAVANCGTAPDGSGGIIVGTPATAITGTLPALNIAGAEQPSACLLELQIDPQ